MNEQLAEFRIGKRALNPFRITDYHCLQLRRVEMRDRRLEYRVSRDVVDVLAIGIVVIWR